MMVPRSYGHVRVSYQHCRSQSEYKNKLHANQSSGRIIFRQKLIFGYYAINISDLIGLPSSVRL